MKDAYNYLVNSDLFNDNDNVVIGVSGGPDSMALLHLLITISTKIKINIICAHINHNVRKESDDEKIFVENYCIKNNITFEYMKIDKYKKNIFSEQEARTIRYKFFDDLMKKYKSKILLTAHHGDDLMETILMRIVRGSTLKGYSGFSKETTINGYKIVRPLIYCTKLEIEDYNNKNNIPFAVDYTNDKDDYTRNRYRHNLLPFLKTEDKDVNKRFLKYSELLLEYNDYVDKQMKKVIDLVYKENKLNIREYLKLDNLIQKRIINYIFEELYSDDLILINDKNLDTVLELIKGNKPNGNIKLPNKILVQRKYDELTFKKMSNDTESFCSKLDKTLLEEDNRFEFLDKEESDSNFICRLNSKDISLPLYVRLRIDGDAMSIKGMIGSKKIKDILINEKISIDKRNNFPVIVDSNNNIVWLPGLKKSKYNKDKSEKHDIIIKYTQKEEK